MESLDPDDQFKLSLQEKFAVHMVGIAGVPAEFYMAVVKSRRRLVVYVEDHGERILVGVKALHESAKAPENLDAAFRQPVNRPSALAATARSRSWLPPSGRAGRRIPGRRVCARAEIACWAVWPRASILQR